MAFIWRKHIASQGYVPHPLSNKWDEAYYRAATELAAEQGISFAVLNENLSTRNGKEAAALRSQLNNRVKRLGGNSNENSNSGVD